MHKSFGRTLLFSMLVFAITTEKVASADSMTPLDRAVSTPKGPLSSPYPDFTGVAEDGYRAYMRAGCHGRGGGMAVSLTNPIWIYGDDDDTFFRVIALGTGSLSPNNAFAIFGYKRKGAEGVEGPMPHFGEIIETDADIWKIIAWIQSVHCKERATGC